MTKIKVAINGFGRIGKLAARLMLTRYWNEVELVAINDPRGDASNAAYLLGVDTAFGRWQGYNVTAVDNIINIEHEGVNQRVEYISSKDPLTLPWAAHNIDVVLECTGIFRDVAGAGQHITAGAKSVIISAPSKSDDISTIVQGVNDVAAWAKLKASGNRILANASCTTNCVSPVIYLLNNFLNIVSIDGVTLHAYTQSQLVEDGMSPKGWREGRAAAQNLIPTLTGASSAVGLVIPEVKDKLTLRAIRAPVVTGSYVHLTLQLNEAKTAQEINNYLKQAASSTHINIIDYSIDELVSSDIIGNPHSCIIDSLLTNVHGKTVNLGLWYDNEWGYSNRLVELIPQILNNIK
jgi:glyceraldehyde 3-phosphate dehydrogenase